MLIFISVLIITIFIHELAHLTVALLCGVKVNAFYIGFGKPTFKTHFFGIDWHITPWLLGGAVDLKEQGLRGIYSVPYKKKVCVYLAGVTSNLLLALLCYKLANVPIWCGIQTHFIDLVNTFGGNLSTVSIKIMNSQNYFWASLGFLNLSCFLLNSLPFPALDGFQIYLPLLEKLIKPFNKYIRVCTIINQIGFFLLIEIQIYLVYLIIKGGIK